MIEKMIETKRYVQGYMGDTVYAHFDKQTVKGHVMELYPYFFTFQVASDPEKKASGYTISFSYQDILSGDVLLGRQDL